MKFLRAVIFCFSLGAVINLNAHFSEAKQQPKAKKQAALKKSHPKNKAKPAKRKVAKRGRFDRANAAKSRFKKWQSSKKKSKNVFYGKASYYHDKLHGFRTATGEMYDAKKYTCAHRWLPFNTIVKVTHLETRKSVKVRVNDRGPYNEHCLIDVSKIAAVELGMFGNGRVPIRMEVLHDSSHKFFDDYILSSGECDVNFGIDTVKKFQKGRIYHIDGFSPDSVKHYALQVNTFRNISNARYDVKNLEANGFYPIYVIYGTAGRIPVFRVYAGQYKTLTEAMNASKRLKKKGYSALVKKLDYGGTVRPEHGKKVRKS